MIWTRVLTSRLVRIISAVIALGSIPPEAAVSRPALSSPFLVLERHGLKSIYHCETPIPIEKSSLRTENSHKPRLCLCVMACSPFSLMNTKAMRPSTLPSSLSACSPNQNQVRENRLFLLLSLALLLQHLLDNLLLLNEEGPHNAVPDAVTAS